MRLSGGEQQAVRGVLSRAHDPAQWLGLPEARLEAAAQGADLTVDEYERLTDGLRQYEAGHRASGGLPGLSGDDDR